MSSGSDATLSPAVAPQPAEVVTTVAVPGDLQVFYVAPRSRLAQRMLFFHPACTHGLGYVQAFAFAAAARGSLVALQGEHECGKGLRSWIGSPPKIQARIDAAWAAAEPNTGGRADGGAGADGRDGGDWQAPALLIGYSQGASVAEALAARYPTAYRRLILIGAPRAVDARALSGLEGAVMMAGTFDNRALMQGSQRALGRVGVPSTFIEIPNARHGQLLDAEAIMGQALAWLAEHARHAP